MLNRSYQTSAVGSEPIFSLGSLAIYSIPYRSVQVSERALAYLNRFQGLNVANLFAFDGASSHFEIWDGQVCLGGFRLCPIGNGKSEVEEIFSDFKFMADSYELGRLWIKDQMKGNGKRCTEIIYSWLSGEQKSIYLKTSAQLAEVAKAYGAQSERVHGWNPKLNYEIELLSLGVLKHG